MAPRVGGGEPTDMTVPLGARVSPDTFERSRERGLSPCEHEGALFPPPTQGSRVPKVKLAPRTTTSPSLPPGSALVKAP